MRSAYNETSLYNLMVVKESKRWAKHDLITADQLAAIREAYKSQLYHPNFIIRVLLFIATLFALAGVSGLFFLFLGDLGEDGLSIAAIFYGIGTFFFLKKVFLDQHHYKSGVTEALLYHAIGYTLGGFMVLADFNIHFVFVVGIIGLTFAAIRYLDLVTTVLSTLTLAGMVFYECYNLGGIYKQIIPFVFILCFTPLYFIVRRLKIRPDLRLWNINLLIVESISLLLIYAAGNYLVVRELSINLMDIALQEGQDIPFAGFFLGLTVVIPIAFLYFGIKYRDVVLLRVSLIVIAFSVFTFKYFYGFGHPEITLTGAGALLLLIAYALFNYLKTERNGFTRENLLSEKWASSHIQAFVVSQTLGGNQVKTDDSFKGGGGEFGGGGATGSF